MSGPLITNNTIVTAMNAKAYTLAEVVTPAIPKETNDDLTILAGTSTSQGTATATAPLFSIPCLASQQSPISGQVGDLSTFDITWPAVGEITKSTAGTFV